MTQFNPGDLIFHSQHGKGQVLSTDLHQVVEAYYKSVGVVRYKTPDADIVPFIVHFEEKSHGI